MDEVICTGYMIVYADGWNHLHLCLSCLNLFADGLSHMHLYICYVNIYADGYSHMHNPFARLCRWIKSSALLSMLW